MLFTTASPLFHSSDRTRKTLVFRHKLCHVITLFRCAVDGIQIYNVSISLAGFRRYVATIQVFIYKTAPGCVRQRCLDLKCWSSSHSLLMIVLKGIIYIMYVSFNWIKSSYRISLFNCGYFGYVKSQLSALLQLHSLIKIRFDCQIRMYCTSIFIFNIIPVNDILIRYYKI